MSKDNQYRLKLVSLISAATVAVAGVAVAVFLPPKAKGSGMPSARAAATGVQKPAVSSQAVTTGYWLRAYNGRIAVFPDGASSPSQVLNTYIASLPEEEQQKLQAGIHVSTKTELLGLIEDYTS